MALIIALLVLGVFAAFGYAWWAGVLVLAALALLTLAIINYGPAIR